MHDSTPAEPESAAICAWCKKVLKPGAAPFSHDVCAGYWKSSCAGWPSACVAAAMRRR